MLRTQSWNWGGKWCLVSWLLMNGALALGGSLFPIACLADSTLAQITPDTTLGRESSTVTSTDTVDTINGGANRGANLFHSFQEFNVEEGRAAVFTNSAGVENILTRVTGANPSNILGTLGVAGGDANLFLINPNGIIFGSNARLDVGGSFVGTTANGIDLANGDSFSANSAEPLPSQLLNVNPNAFFFNQVNAQAIINRSTAADTGLEVPTDRSLLLVGGDVRLEGGQILAPGGRVEIGGVASAGTVGLNVNGSQLSLSFLPGEQLSNISFTNGAVVDVTAGGSGNIAINAQNLNLVGESSLQAGIDSGLGSVSSEAGDIEIKAIGAIALTEQSLISNSVQLAAIGKGGNINITTGSLSVIDGSELFASSNGQGDAGSVNIAARSTVEFIGESPDFNSSAATSRLESRGVGQAGSVNITTGALAVADGAFLDASTFGQGDAGNVNIAARDTVKFTGLGPDRFSSGAYSQVSRSAEGGNAGSISIKAGSLSITDGAVLATSTFGQGNAGTITLDVRNKVEFKAGDELGNIYSYGGAYSRVEAGAEAQTSGNINIKAGSLAISDGAELSTSTNGIGNAGDIILDARDTIEFEGLSFEGFPSGTFSQVLEGAEGNAGNISIKAGSLSVTDGAVLATGTREQGNAGNITVDVRDRAEFKGGDEIGSVFPYSGAYSGVGSGANGQAGNIAIKTGSLSVIDGALIATDTRGQGKAGNVTIEARDTVEFTGLGPDRFSSGAYSQVLTDNQVLNGAEENPGSISIKARSLSVTDGAVLATSTFGQRNAGNVTIDVRDRVEFKSGEEKGRDFPYGGAYSRVEAGAEAQQGGDVNIKTGSLAVSNGAELSTSTDGIGNAGNIILDARDTIEFEGLSFEGIPTGAYSQVLSGATGQGGSITIKAGSLSVTDGAVLATSTREQGNAGNITVDVRDRVEFKGGDETGSIFPNGGAYSQVESRGVGQGGDLTITTEQLIVQEGAQVAVSSEGIGNAGNLKITSRNLQLDSQGVLRATTASGEGGNISLQEQNLILMRGNSEISTEARGTGNGGNIEIVNADFIIAVPSENSDIIANAFEGNGGNININTQGIFGLQYRDRLTQDSEINASSEFGIDGTVEIDTPDIDPSQGLVSLPAVPVEPEVAQACTPGGSQQQSEFVVTGRGGLPPNPTEALSSDAIEVDWVTLNPGTEGTASPTSATNPTSSAKQPLVEAQGWVTDNNGEVILTASASTTTPDSFWQSPANCHATQSAPRR